MTLEKLNNKYAKLETEYTYEELPSEYCKVFMEELHVNEINACYDVLNVCFETILNEIIKLDKKLYSHIDIKYYGSSFNYSYISINGMTIITKNAVLNGFKIKDGFYYENIHIKDAISKFEELFDKELSARLGMNVKRFTKTGVFDNKTLIKPQKKYKAKDDCSFQSLVLFVVFLLVVCLLSVK